LKHRLTNHSLLYLQNKESDTDIKIADFGFATREFEPNCLTTVCGTPNYVAPEIIMHIPYGKQVDMWSLGTIVFLLLGGYAPFDEPDVRTQYRRIKEADYEFTENLWSHASEDAKDFISKHLVVDPGARITSEEATEHKWLSADNLADRDLGQTKNRLRRFQLKRKLKGAAMTVVLSQRFSAAFEVSKSQRPRVSSFAVSHLCLKKVLLPFLLW
jgi:serine/threonine protein kinase